MVSNTIPSSTSSTTTSATATSTPPVSRELLLLQKEIFTIYLEPLLKIHHSTTTTTSIPLSAGTNNNTNVLTYEDLISSFQSAVASLGKTSNIDNNGKVYVRQKLIALHQSQIQAYRIAAKKALTEWAKTVPLPEINRTIHDTLPAYIKSCRAVTIATRPVWRDTSSPSSSSSSNNNTSKTSKELPINEIAMNIIDERAKKAFEHGSSTASMENIEEGEERDGEDGEIEETTGDTSMGNSAIGTEIGNDEGSVVVKVDDDDEEGAIKEVENTVKRDNNDVATNTATSANVKTSNSKIAKSKASMSIDSTKSSQQQQQQPTTQSKRVGTAGKAPAPSVTKKATTSTVPNKKTIITKPKMNTASSSPTIHRNNMNNSNNNNAISNNRGGRGGGNVRGMNNNMNHQRGGRGGGGGGK